MDIVLLSQNLILLLTIVATAISTYLLVSTNKKWLKKWLSYKSAFLFGGALIGALLIELEIHFDFPSDKLPERMWLMIVPFTLSISLIVIAWHSVVKWQKWLALGNAVICLFVSLLLINNFYGFYPTLFSVFGADSSRFITKNQTTVQYGSVGAGERSASVESKLYGDSSASDGTVSSLVIPGAVSNFTPRTEYVYMPAAASSLKNVNLPVLVLMPGYPGITSNWLAGGLKHTLDAFAKQHHGITPMVFMVDNTGSLTNDTECVDSGRGNLETYLTVDVPNYIKQHYKVDDNASNWGIGGLSMGGMCSAMLALRHPDVYRYFLDFSGEKGPEVGNYNQTVSAIFNGSSSDWKNHQIPYLLSKRKYYGMGGFFTIGNEDSSNLIIGTNALYIQAQKAGIESIYQKFSGEHNFRVWEESFKYALPWVSNRLGATECTVYCHV